MASGPPSLSNMGVFIAPGRILLPLSVQVKGPLIVDTPTLLFSAALDGVGLAYGTESAAADHLLSGRLIQVLKSWSPSIPGFYLYFPAA
jgi:DNA-binding transcriptional LysR family regulator